MRICIVSIGFWMLLSSYAMGQDTIVIHYDKKWNEVAEKYRASFYRKAFQDGDGKWTVNDYYIDGNIQMRGAYTSKNFKKRDGHFVYFHENGFKSSEGNYVENRAEGIWTYWHANGEKKSEGLHRRGLRQGKWCFWHDNGKHHTDGLYVDDKAEGHWQYWFETGELQSEGDYRNGSNHGKWTYYHRFGGVRLRENYVEGELVSVEEYYQPGMIKFKLDLVKGVGEGIVYGMDGKEILKGMMVKGFREGVWTRFFANGTSMIIHYEKGEVVSKRLGGVYKKGFAL